MIEGAPVARDDPDDRYWWQNRLAGEEDRLHLLEKIADPRSVRLLSELGVSDGWRCAELGAGAGSMTAWLADRVGRSGSVVAVDRDVTLLHHLAERPNVAITESTIERWCLDAESFDLIHTRNVLMHIDDADDVIPRLVTALRPGGRLLLEEADYYPMGGVDSAPFADVFHRLVGRWTWARTIPSTLATLDVTDINVQVDAPLLQGRSAEAAFWVATLESARQRLLDPAKAVKDGFSPLDQSTLDRVLAVLADETFWTPLAAVICTSCRR